MKNKKVQVVLIIVVLLIWGTILYKFLFYNDDEQKSEIVFRNEKEKENTNIIPDTFNLLCNYNDPFLSGVVFHENITESADDKESETKLPEIKNVIKPVVWPELKYCGLIQNIKSESKTGLLKINKKEYVIYENFIVKDIVVVKVYNDSIILKLEEEIKTLKKQGYVQ